MTGDGVKQVKGVRVRRTITWPNRWGDGKVHIETWRLAGIWAEVRSGRGWLPACSDTPYHSRDVIESDLPSLVTCKKCLATGLVPKAWRP